jgi:hypothetical protein
MPSEYQLLENRLATFWRDPQMFGFNLLVLFMDVYGAEGLNWMPETIEMEIRDDSGVDLPEANFDKLLTAISLLVTDNFFVSPTDFTRACVVLSGHVVNPGSLILPDCADLAWGLTEGMMINPPDEDNEAPFSKEIVAYVGACLNDEGILNPPDILRIGLRDKDLADNARYSFSDDPEMMAAISGFEEDKTSSINSLVLNRLKDLFAQLQLLPLKNGQAVAVARKMMAGLAHQPASGSPLNSPV